jgi:anti-anti-sigma factor
MDMQITTLKAGAVTVAILDGRLDTVTAAGAEQTLLALLQEGALVADLEGVRYMSSAGLRLLLKAAKAAKGAGVSFSVCASQPAVREVFEISGFNKVIPAFATRDEAVSGA